MYHKRLSPTVLFCFHSACFLPIFLFPSFTPPHLSFLLLVLAPRFPFAPLQDPADDDAAHGDYVYDKVDGCPVVDGVRGLQEHEAHAHVVVGPHLQEPVNPVENALSTRTQPHTNGGLHGGFGCDAQGNGEEGEVVACVQSVPVGADQHRPASPGGYKQERWFSLLYLCCCCKEKHFALCFPQSWKSQTLFVCVVGNGSVKAGSQLDWRAFTSLKRFCGLTFISNT